MAELTGVPTLYRWLRAIAERRPIHEIEREYFEPLYRQLQQLAAPGLLRLETPQLRGVVPVDYIAEGKRAPPVQAQIDPEYVRKMLQEVGAPTSPEDVAGQVAGRSVVLSLTALPGLAGLTKEAAKQLAKIAAAGFGVGGTGAAVARAAQGFPEEVPGAFFEVGLASTVVADVANALRALAASVSAPQLRAAARQVLLRRQAGSGPPWRDPEGEAFIKEVEGAILALKRGDTSKYDALLKQFEEWQAKIEEFRRLYEAKQRGQLTPEDEARYTKLLKEVAEIRDKYDLLKQYIETARETGIEAGARRAELEARTIEDLARAAQEAPPGPPPKDWMQWLQRLDVGFLLKLTKDPNMLAKYARRFGVDEQTLAERAVLMLRGRQWENLANMPQDELKKILMDEQLLKKYASEFNVSEDKLRAFIEDVLQGRVGVKPPEPTPEKPPIEPKREQPKPPETQFRPPETEGHTVTTREGQVLIVRPKEEEPQLTVKRLDDSNLPTVEARLRYLLRRRRRLDEEAARDWNRLREEATGGQRRTREDTARTTDETPGRTTDETPNRTTDNTPDRTTDNTPTKTVDETPTKTVDRTVERVTEKVTVVDRDTLRMFIPLLPASVFAMPAAVVLPLLSRVVGSPIALAPGIPRPLPRESFANWLDRVFAGSGFSWRSLAAQRETFVFA